MEYHSILQRQINKHLPEEYLKDEKILHFLKNVSTYYNDCDIDKEMSEHAFDISEKEYEEVLSEQKATNKVLHESIQQLKSLLAVLQPENAKLINKQSDDIGEIIGILQQLTTKSNKLGAELNKKVQLLEDINKISNIFQHNISKTSLTDAATQMMQAMLEMFGAGRVWLAYPYSEHSDSINVIIEATAVTFNSTLEINNQIALSKEFKNNFTKQLNNPDEFAVTCSTIDAAQAAYFAPYDIRSSLYISIKPSTGEPWILGLHHCENEHQWTEDERNLFKRISDKITLSLNALLLTEILKKSEAKFKSLLENSDDIIVNYDLKGNMFYINPKGLDFLGLEATEVSNKNVFDLIATESKENVMQRLQERQMGQEHARIISVQLMDKNKKSIPFEINSSLSTLDNGATGILAFARNISERKIFEEKLLKQNAELHRINQELDRFVYSTSHDLRSPLTSVLGLIELSKEQIEKEDKIHAYLQMMESAIINLDNVIKSILEYSKSSRLEKKNVMIKMEKIYNSIISGLSYVKGIKTIRFNSEIDSTTPFISDEISLSSIVKNLITNSVKYRKQDTDCEIKFSFVATGKEGIITVEDNGIGIEESQFDKIFDMFYRATNSAEGSGLGLYIVRQNIEKLNGKLELESKHGIGTKFTVRIPNELSGSIII